MRELRTSSAGGRLTLVLPVWGSIGKFAPAVAYSLAVLFAILGNIAWFAVDSQTRTAAIACVPFIFLSGALCGPRPAFLTTILCMAGAWRFATQAFDVRDFAAIALLGISGGMVSLLFHSLRHTERSLQAASQELSALHASAPVMLMLMDEQLRVQKTNVSSVGPDGRKSSELHGLRTGAVMDCNHAGSEGENCGESAECDDCGLHAAMLDSLKTGARHKNIETSLPVLVNGEESKRFLSVSTAPVELEDGRRVLVCAQDTTDQKRAQVEFDLQREALERQSRLINLSHDAIIATDPTGVIQFWNSGAEAMYGWTEKEAVGNKLHELLQTQPPIANLEMLNRMGHWEGELLQTCRDGRQIITETRQVMMHDSSGKGVSALKISRDITARRRAEEELKIANTAGRRHLAQLEAVLEHMTEGVIISDLDGNLYYENAAAAAILLRDKDSGQRTADVFQHWQLWANPDTKLSHRDWPLNRILRGETIRDCELLARGPMAKEHRVLRFGGRLVRDANGDAILAVLTVSDVTESRRAEEKLTEREYLLRMICETALDSIYLKDRDGRIVLANPATLRRLGKSEQKVIGSTDEFFRSDPNAAALIRKNDQIVFETGSALVVEEQAETAQGLRTFSSTKVPWRNAKGDVVGLIGISRDITERKEAEAALAQLAELRRLALEAASLGAWDYRFDIGVVFWDERCRAMYGVESGDRIEFDDAISRIHEEDQATTKLAVERAINGEEQGQFHCEFRVVWLDGSLHWIASHGRVYVGNDGLALRFIGVNMDITERKHAEAAMRAALADAEEGRRLLGAVFAAQTDGILVCDPQRTIIRTNPAARDFFGFEPTGMQLVEMLHRMGFPKREQPGVTERALNGEIVIEVEQDLGDRVLESSSTPLRDEKEGRVVGAVTVTRDITKRKSAEQAVRDTVRELESSLAERTILLKEVHHRVKNNLAMISSLLSMQSEACSTDDARLALEESHQRVQSIALIHEHLYGTEHLDRVDFSEYARQLVDELYMAFVADPERITIEFDVKPIELGVHRAVPCALILNELVSNAFKYAFPNGRKGRIGVVFEQVVPNVMKLVVWDDGVGIPEELDWTTSNSLGRQIIQILAQQLGAQLVLHRDNGTRFELTFNFGTTTRGGLFGAAA